LELGFEEDIAQRIHDLLAIEFPIVLRELQDTLGDFGALAEGIIRIQVAVQHP